MIKITGLSKKFKNNTIIDDVTITFKKGDFIVITGENGSGKSTFLKLILNQYIPTKGKIEVESKKIAFIPENVKLPDNISLIDFINTFKNIYKFKTEELNYYLELYDLLDYSNEIINNLSKGTRQKILLVLVLLKKIDILICDELISGLDIQNQITIKKFIQTNLNKGVLVIISTHFPDVYKELSSINYKMVGGKLT